MINERAIKAMDALAKADEELGLNYIDANDNPDHREVMRQALEALEDHAKQYPHMQKGYTVDAINALRNALAEPAPEPVAWMRVIDEAMVTHCLGVADPADDYETAKRKMNNLLCMAQDIGTYFAKQAEPVQEPVAWVECDGDLVWNNREAAIGRNLYAHPPQRKPLTEEEIAEISIELAASHQHFDIQLARAIERAHGIGGQE